MRLATLLWQPPEVEPVAPLRAPEPSAEAQEASWRFYMDAAKGSFHLRQDEEAMRYLSRAAAW